MTVKPLLFVLCAALLTVAADSPASVKPTLKVGADGLPAGHDTPEGAACDLARAFVKRDAALFVETCIKPFGGGQARADYEKFLADVKAGIEAEAAKKTPSPGGPQVIKKVFAARHLSKDGPASYGYAMYNFQDVMFVDVGVLLANGDRSLNRTMVIKAKDGKWYVHPAPATGPLLSAGLNEESDSTQDFTDAYVIGR